MRTSLRAVSINQCPRRGKDLSFVLLNTSHTRIALELTLHASNHPGRPGSCPAIDAAEVILEADRRIGELSRELPKAPAGNERVKPKPDARAQEKAAALEDIGITTQRASECERLASLPRRDFEAYKKAELLRDVGITDARQNTAETRPKPARDKRRRRTLRRRARVANGDRR